MRCRLELVVLQQWVLQPHVRPWTHTESGNLGSHILHCLFYLRFVCLLLLYFFNVTQTGLQVRFVDLLILCCFDLSDFIFQCSEIFRIS